MDLAPKPPEKTDQSANTLLLDAEAAGLRLDCALSLLVKEGLRGRRRRIKEGSVLVNGAPCPNPAHRVKAGDLLALLPKAAPKSSGTQAGLVGQQGDFCFFFKDAGLHTAALAGKDCDSLERRLPELLKPSLGEEALPILLQRLDKETSGLVCAALTPKAASIFRKAENAGLCEKRYLALLAGALDCRQTARWRLNTQARRTVRLLPEEAEPWRWTEFFPLHVWEGKACIQLHKLLQDAYSCAWLVPSQAITLAACRIRRGARHQIRAHAAALGFPLLGDTRYAKSAPTSETSGHFFLHHGHLAWGCISCSLAPPWPWLDDQLPPPAQALAHRWLSPDQNEA